LPRLCSVLLAMVAVQLVACTASRIASVHFAPPGDVEWAIMRHYERYASEGGCFRPSIDGFTTTTVLEDTADRLVIDTRYLWRDRFQEGGGSGQVCRGFGERTFTLERDPAGRVVVTGMSGEQDEPVIRSLIRRVLPN
jgi:hypothetical protein